MGILPDITSGGNGIFCMAILQRTCKFLWFSLWFTFDSLMGNSVSLQHDVHDVIATACPSCARLAARRAKPLSVTWARAGPVSLQCAAKAVSLWDHTAAAMTLVIS